MFLAERWRRQAPIRGVTEQLRRPFAALERAMLGSRVRRRARHNADAHNAGCRRGLNRALAILVIVARRRLLKKVALTLSNGAILSRVSAAFFNALLVQILHATVADSLRLLSSILPKRL